MYVSIRRYEGVGQMDEIARRVDEDFVSIISDVPGFVAYYLVDAGNGSGATISVFESQAAAEQSNRRAADWIKENLAPLAPNAPEIWVGEVKVHKTA